MPAFFVILGLTIAYAGLGLIPIVRGALYGLGPVVLAIFAVAVYRLGLTAARTIPQAVICVLAAVTAIGTPLGIAAILVLAGAAGLLIFPSGNCEPSDRVCRWPVWQCSRRSGAPRHRPLWLRPGTSPTPAASPTSRPTSSRSERSPSMAA